MSFDAAFAHYPQARAGIEQAAVYWHSVLADPVTVPLRFHVASLFDLPFFALAVCETHTQDAAYADFRPALLADASSASDKMCRRLRHSR